MAATVRASIYAASASEPAGVTAETGIKWNKEDTANGTTPIGIPTTANGTNYSWHKNLALEVTTLGATTISNRRWFMGAAPSTGLYLFWKGASTYVQAASVGADDASTNGVVPSTYALASAITQGTAHVWHAAGVSAGATGRNGDLLRICGGVSPTFVGGAGSATAGPTLNLVYDEA